jgi:hypothetical protein
LPAALDPFPPLPLSEWADTKETLHRFSQIVGKLRLRAGPFRNHWWHVPLYVPARGVATSPLEHGGRVFEIAFDYRAHELQVDAVPGRTASFSLPGLSVAEFYTRLRDALAAVGVALEPERPYPFDRDDAVPFAEDTRHSAYDQDAVTRYWRILAGVDSVLKTFAGRYSGKTSPVHHFWHTFDIAVTRFSGRPAPVAEDADAVTREAYSHEVVSFGFWFGDDRSYPDPAFYAYTHPEPDGLTEHALEPATARWVESGPTHLALLPYADARAADDPRAAILAFLESAWRAGTAAGGWPLNGRSAG